MKKILPILVCLFGLLGTNNAEATLCSNYTTYADGQVLTAGSLNALQSNYTNCFTDIENGFTMTGTLNIHSSGDLNIYTDTGSTLVASIDGATGSFIGAPVRAGTYNINLASATTSVTRDSIKVQCGSTACSATNPGFVVTNGTTAGNLTVFKVVADVTLNLTGAHWGAGTTGDLTGRITRVLAANDNGTLRWCVALLGGRDVLLTTDTTATATSVTASETVLCNTAVASATNTVLEVGYFRSDFDDTGGSSEDLNIIQSGVGDVVTGKSPDGMWQPWNPTFTGFSSSPTATTSKWSQVGRLIRIIYVTNASGTSNSTAFTIALPVKSAMNTNTSVGPGQDNGANLTTPSLFQSSTASATGFLYKDMSYSGTAWTNVSNKACDISAVYEVGPVASFIN